MTPTHRPRGFTLVELLVVIGIISLLIAILLPSLNRARDSARKVQCGSNIRSLGQLLHLYANDWSGRYPVSYGSDNPGKVSNHAPFGPLSWGEKGVIVDGLDRGTLPAGLAILYDEGYFERPRELLYCPALNPQLSPDEYWRYDPLTSPQWSDNFSNYCYWGNYTPADDLTWIIGPDERRGTGAEEVEPGKARAADFWARGQNSPADTVLMSELNAQIGVLADKFGPSDTRLYTAWTFTNHVDSTVTNNRPAGGNLMMNDGSVRFVPFGDLKWRAQQTGLSTGMSFYY